MIDFTGQVAVVTEAGRGLGRLYALELARRGASVVVNDVGGTMRGHGADRSVADRVALEIERAGGVAVASHDSVDSVIAIEGAPHGILANSVLPFGSSRMVTETVGAVDDPKRLEESGFLKAIQPELVVPIVVFLASRACQLTHHNYSACAGRFARVFVGLGEGWLAKAGSVPNAEDIAAHLGEISATEPFSVPASIVDEVVGICSRLGIAA